MKEKRKYFRVRPADDEPVELQIMSGNFLEILHVQDVSEGGVSVRVPHGFDASLIGKTHDAILTLPGDIPFKIKGTIRHGRDNAGRAMYGIEFQHSLETSRFRIRRYVIARRASMADGNASVTAVSRMES